ncbi:hypothetical protein DXG01_012616 [Tephrocybe rancida]|nr:hypothetical protein DXG01_012616 [Tephrocybe rancida]
MVDRDGPIVDRMKTDVEGKKRQYEFKSVREPQTGEYTSILVTQDSPRGEDGFVIGERERDISCRNWLMKEGIPVEELKYCAMRERITHATQILHGLIMKRSSSS